MNQWVDVFHPRHQGAADHRRPLHRTRTAACPACERCAQPGAGADHTPPASSAGAGAGLSADADDKARARRGSLTAGSSGEDPDHIDSAPSPATEARLGAADLYPLSCSPSHYFEGDIAAAVAAAVDANAAAARRDYRVDHTLDAYVEVGPVA